MLGLHDIGAGPEQSTEPKRGIRIAEASANSLISFWTIGFPGQLSWTHRVLRNMVGLRTVRKPGGSWIVGRSVGDVIGYARVSTDDQDLEGQRIRLTQAGATRVFSDKVSGRIDERPGLSALLDYVRPGDTVVVVRLDRLGRSLPRLLDLVEDFKRRGLGFTSLEERIDTSSAGGELIFHVFGALAQFERRLIGDRTRDGLAAARARGKRIGRPARDPEKIEAALLLVAGGLSVARAAVTVGLGRATLYEEVRLRRSEGSTGTGSDQGTDP